MLELPLGAVPLLEPLELPPLEVGGWAQAALNLSHSAWVVWKCFPSGPVQSIFCPEFAGLLDVGFDGEEGCPHEALNLPQSA